MSSDGEEKEWINHEWLPQIIFYLLYKYGSFSAVVLFAALMGTAIFILLLRHKKFSWLLILFLFLTAFSLKPFIVPRPQIFAYLMLLGTVLSLDWYYRTKNKKIVFTLPIIIFLWGNIHASVILALVIFSVVLFFEFFSVRWLKYEKLNSDERNHLIKTFIFSVAGSLVNPFGYKIYSHALQPLLFSGAYNLLLETQPVYKVLSQPFILTTHLLIILLYFFHIPKRHSSVLRPYEFLLAALFLAMPFFAIKYIPFAWAVSVPILLKVLPDFNKKLLVWPAIIGILIFSTAVFFREKNLLKDASDEWPREIISFIKEHELQGNVYHPYSWSGYVAWELKRPVFINAATTDLGGDAFWDGIDFEKGERVNEIIEKYDLSLVISPSWIPLPYAMSLKDDWALVYWDNFGTVFVKKTTENRELVDDYFINLRYFNDSVESVLEKYEPEEVPELIKNYEEAIRRQPDLLLARYRLGLIHQLSDNCPKAIEQYKELLDIDFELGSAHFRLAECYQEISNLRLAAQEEKLGEKYVKEEKWWKGRR